MTGPRLAGRLLILAVGLSCTRAPDAPIERPRLVVIGIDGADWDILEPLVAEGRMPTLAKLMAQGSYGTLETIEPILSPIIWTTIATGRRPSEHGITWFMERDAAGNTKPISSRQRKVPAIWNIASDAGLKVGVYGWWATWPAESINGFVVSDHVAAHGFGLTGRNVGTDLGRTHPANLLEAIETLQVQPSQISDSEVLEYMQLTDEELATRRGDAMDFHNPLHHFLYALAAHHTYENIGRTMLSEHETDLSLHYFEATDSLSHLFMKFADPPLEGIAPAQRARFKGVVEGIYRRQDRVLRSLLQAAGPETNVVIVSDHGFKTGNARLVENVHTSVRRAHEWHERHGVILMWGPSIRQGTRLEASIYDVTPTLLYLLGEPAGTTMPGRVLTEAIVAEELQRSPPKEVVTYAAKPSPAATSHASSATRKKSSAEIEPSLLARLEALGYLDTTTTPEILLNRARTALDEGDQTKSAAVLEELLAAHPTFLEAELFALRLAEHHSDPAQTLERWKAIASRPSLAEERRVQRGYTQALSTYGRTSLALERARRSVEAASEPLDWVLYARLLASEGGDPLSTLQRGVRAHPRDPALQLKLSEVLIAEGEHDSALRILDALPTDWRLAPEAQLLRGQAASARVDRRTAIAAWTHAAERAPRAYRPRSLLGELAMQEKRFADAERWLSEATALGAGARVWLLRARNARASGNLPLAQRFADRARQLPSPR